MQAKSFQVFRTCRDRDYKFETVIRPSSTSVRLLREASVFLAGGAPGVRAGVRAVGVSLGGALCVRAGDEHDSIRDALDARLGFCPRAQTS